MLQSQCGEQVVRAGWSFQSFLLSVGIKQRADAQKQKIHHQHNTGEHIDIFFSSTQGTAAQIFLHRVLVEASHGDGNERTANQLLEEEFFVMPVPMENLVAVV